MNWKRMNLEELREMVASVVPAGHGHWTVRLDDGTEGITTNSAAVDRYQDTELTDGQACGHGYTIRTAHIILGEATNKKKTEKK